MALVDIPHCEKCKQSLKKLSENATHAMWACGSCGKGYQIKK